MPDLFILWSFRGLLGRSHCFHRFLANQFLPGHWVHLAAKDRGTEDCQLCGSVLRHCCSMGVFGGVFGWVLPPSQICNSPIHMQKKASTTHSAANPGLVVYFILGVKSFHCSRFSATGKRRWTNQVVLYHCFMLAAENVLSSTMVKWV